MIHGRAQVHGIEGGLRRVSQGLFLPLLRSTKPPFLDNFAAATVLRIWSRLFSLAAVGKTPEQFSYVRSQKYSVTTPLTACSILETLRQASEPSVEQTSPSAFAQACEASQVLTGIHLSCCPKSFLAVHPEFN